MTSGLNFDWRNLLRPYFRFVFQERRLEDVTKTLSGGDAKSKTSKKQQKSNQQPMHNNNKTGNSSSSGSDSSDSSSSSSEDSDSDSEAETKQAQNNVPRPNESAPKLPHNSVPAMPQQQQPQAIPHPDSVLGNNLKVRNDLMPGGRLSENATPNSLLQQHHQLLQQQQQQQQPQLPQPQQQQPFPQSNFPGGVAPLQQPSARQYNQSVIANQQQSPSPTQLLQQQQQQQQQQLAKMNAPPVALSQLSTATNSSNNEIPSIDSPAGPQKTKAMLKGWSSLAGPGSAGTMASGGPVPSMTGPVSGMPIPVNPAHHGIPASVGPAPDHQSRLANVNKSQFLQQKASDTFNAFRKAAQEKTERERQLKEQQESIRMKKEAAERERKRQENERRREQAEEEMLEQARRSMQIGRPGFPPNSAMDNGNGASTGISPPGMSPVTTEAARAQLLRQREREKEQERRRREAKAGGIDMNMQSDLMAAFEENII